MRSRLFALLTAAVLVAGCGSDTSKDKEAEATPAAAASATPTPTPVPTEAAAAGCTKVAPPKSKGPGKLSKPTEALDPSKTYVATVVTSCGNFEITLDVKRAPKTAASFAYLAGKKFFDKTTFHRIVPGFVIQGGDPLGNGTGGPGYTVTEKPPADLKYTTGVVAMAKASDEPSGASGSQFFVVTGGDVMLPPDYALLGKISGGEDAIQAISTTPTNGEAPVSPVVIVSVSVKAS